MTSGTTNHNLSFDDIFILAIDDAGGDPTNADELRRAKSLLNMLLLEMANKNLLSYKVEETIVTCSTSQNAYPLVSSIGEVYRANIIYSGSDLQLGRDSMEEFFMISQKNRLGRPTRFWVDRQREACTFYVWPTPNDEYEMRLKVYKIPEDVGEAYNDVDVPVRFIPAIVKGLAYKIASKRSRDQLGEAKAVRLKMEYMEALEDAMAEDRDRASFFIVPGG